ncbi:hypothetical protein G7046_g4367 [Stylonectria norvegica]|nr:hypothetical protein G7046_g4367 [Stylonectria norvegica]
MAQHNDSNPPHQDDSSMTEPMTALSGSDAMVKDDGGDSAPGYGTRSRNRHGNSRPNYAEDKDIEMDQYDFYHEKKDGDTKKSSRQASAAANANANGDVTRGGANPRKAGTDDTKVGLPQNGSKEQHSGGSTTAPPTTTTMTAAATSTAVVATQPSGVSQPSRKRKAAAQSSGPTAPTASSNALTRKAGTAAAQELGISWPDTNMLTFDNCNARPDNRRLVADDGTVLEPNDHVYLVCEPPGEPYYLGRIMEFLYTDNDPAKPVDSVRINWYYRPKDIARKTSDTRMLFATMHSDISPLTALRGKCQIRHKVEIKDMKAYRKTPDCFWFDKLYDRYIQKNYELIPVSFIVNVPPNVKKVLDERWKYVLVEQGRGKELVSAVKLCKRCSGYCASNDSVDCAVCRNTYHMNCVSPPLQKKPSRGFAWSCAACSRAQERRLEARNTPNVNDDLDDEDLLDEEEEDAHGAGTNRTSPDDDDHAHHAGTADQIYQASLWPYRYLGMHCKLQDALDYDDRIYPRASTRIGPRNQATVTPWPGRPVQYVKPETKKNGKKDAKASKEAQAALEAYRGKRPKWIQDSPPGYTERGEDYDEDDPRCTATPMWKPVSKEVIEPEQINQYMEKAKALAGDLGLPARSTNLQHVAADTLFHSSFDSKAALALLPKLEKSAFKEPELTAAEQKKFEEGVLKYGSELHSVKKHVKTLHYGTVVRYYYTWKKTERGRHVCANHAGRKGKKQLMKAEAAASKFADDVANDDDDSAFDTTKASERKRAFMCQFCSTTSSRQWRRAPNATPGLVNENGVKATNKDKGNQYVVGLCRRCAELWRRYAIRWEDMDEVAKKVNQAGGRAWKRKQDEELLKELQVAHEMGMMTPDRAPTPSTGASSSNGHEPPRKKLKSAPEKETTPSQSDAGSASTSVFSKKEKKEKSAEKAAEKMAEKEKNMEKSVEIVAVPEVPKLPKPRTLPCAICDQLEPLGEQHLSCRECRLTVHRNCYGVIDIRNPGKWVCDLCANDKSPQLSIQYKCCLCPVEYTEHDFVEQPKLTHHKKKMSEKDREREKLEVQQARKAAEHYRKKQEDMNRPVNPREPLKRTADNNWVHVTCAVWTPEVKFGNAKALEPSEGIPSVPRSRYEEICQVCSKTDGACVSCHQCRAPVHVECARQQGYVLGFDITPVKSSRRDQFNIVTIGTESGTMSAAIWCKEHAPTKTTVHPMHEVVNGSGLNALQLYVQNFKQADLTLTGTVRKAMLMTAAAKLSGTPAQASLRRASTTAVTAGGWTQRNGDSTNGATDVQQLGDKVCISCGIDISPKWWPIDNSQERELTNGYYGTLGSEAQKFVEQRKYQCHKCRKAHRTPKPHAPKPTMPPVEAPRDPRPPMREPILPVSAPPVQQSPPMPMSNHRESHGPNLPWQTQVSPHAIHPLPLPGHTAPPHPVPPHAAPPHAPPHSAPHTAHSVLQSPAQVHEHGMGPRPPQNTHNPYPPPHPPPQRSVYNDWGPRPSSQHSQHSQHGSPPRHLNGGPPPLHNSGPPPMGNFSALRPPPLSGPPPPPPGSMAMNHPGGHVSQPYSNGLPPSPRRLNGPAPPPRYVHPYNAPQHHGPPHHGPPHHGTTPFPKSYMGRGRHIQDPIVAHPALEMDCLPLHMSRQDQQGLLVHGHQRIGQQVVQVPVPLCAIFSRIDLSKLSVRPAVSPGNEITGNGTDTAPVFPETPGRKRAANQSAQPRFVASDGGASSLPPCISLYLSLSRNLQLTQPHLIRHRETRIPSPQAYLFCFSLNACNDRVDNPRRFVTMAQVLLDLFYSLGNCMSCFPGSPTLKINNRSFKILRLLGEGGFSYVYLVEDTNSHQLFALKKIRCPFGAESVQQAMREVDAYRLFAQVPTIISAMDHSVATERGADEATKTVYVLLPYYKRGNLQDMINANLVNHDRFPERRLMMLFLGVCKALRAMHEYKPPVERMEMGHEEDDHHGGGEGAAGATRGKRTEEEEEGEQERPLMEGENKVSGGRTNQSYAHRDIKPGNIMIDDTGSTPILMDLGSVAPSPIPITSQSLALQIQDTAAEHSTMPYRAPELFDVRTGTVIDTKVDIWSLGCTLYACLVGKSPFEARSDETGGTLSLCVLGGDWRFPDEGPPGVKRNNSMRPQGAHQQGAATPAVEISEPIREVVRKCLRVEPAERPDITELIDMVEGVIEDLSDDST